MPRAPPTPITPTKRGRIQEMVELGMTYRHIAEKIGCSPSSVAFTVKRFKDTGSHYTRSKSGRPQKLSERDTRAVLRTIRLNKWKDWQSISKLMGLQGINASAKLIRRVAADAGIRRYAARSRPALTQTAIKTRLARAKSNQLTEWRRIIYTDECSFDSSTLRRKPFVSRLKGTAHLPKNTCRSLYSARKTVMVWAAITYGKKSPIIRVFGSGRSRVDSQAYIENVINGTLRDFVLECELAHLSPYKVVEDNASIHNSRATSAARLAAGLQRQPHPPLSPDLNPIEKAWRLLKSRLRGRNLTRASAEQVWEAIKEEWDRIEPEELNKYIDDMPKRVKQCRKRKGRFTE